jgi:phytoene dehydrogenase-like protein
MSDARRSTGDDEALVVGAGPNGLAAAVVLARAGLRVTVYEKDERPGGGAATRELTLPGFLHDVCSAVHPLAFESRFFREFGLAERVRFAVPELSFAHPLDGGRAGLAYRDLRRTAEELGRDGSAYARLMGRLSRAAQGVADFTGSPLLRVPRHPVTAVRFALASLEQGTPAWGARFREDVAPAMLTGVSAHTILPLPSLAAAGAGLALTAYAHGQGWPVPVGGSQAIIDAMVADVEAHGGRLVTGHHVTDLRELPPARLVLLDVTPDALLRMRGADLPAGYRAALTRFRYGNAVAKVDFALSDPVPWRSPAVGDAAAVHVGGSRAEIAAGERDVARGRLPASPYVLASEPTRFDPSRAPAGKHTLWTYTHVPRGSTADRTKAIVAQIERFAPGFRDTILQSSSRTAVEVAAHNPSYPGGDIAAGAPDLVQLLKRPTVSPRPWATPLPGVYLCSASTSPGPGVHGLAGYHAARQALADAFGAEVADSVALSPVS